MTDKRLEFYLESLSSALQSMTHAKRSEIITSTRIEFMQLMSEGQTFEEALSKVGSVAEVLYKNGLIYDSYKSSTTRILRTFSIFILSIFILTAISIFGLFRWAKNSTFEIGDLPIDVRMSGNWFPLTESVLPIEETHDPKMEAFSVFDLQFSNGKVRVQTSETAKLNWRCNIRGVESPILSTLENGQLKLNLIPAFGSKCDIFVPKELKINIRGGNGEIKFVEPEFPVDTQLGNGRVFFAPKEKQAYKYDFNIANGRVPDLKSSASPDALHIKIDVTNGEVEKDSL